MAFFRIRGVALGLFCFLYFCARLWSQTAVAEGGDPAALIGLTLGELWEQYGPPLEVHAARGAESWQDDVVFRYAEGDFYIYRDRVWQLSLRDAYGLKLGDPRGMIPALLGEDLEEFERRALRPLLGWNWPLVLQIDFNGTGQVSAIYIYRSDF
jgi:hypothetical protein